MAASRKKLLDSAGNTATFLLTKQPEDFVDTHRVKIVIVGSGYTGVAVGIAILFKVRRTLLISDSNLILGRSTWHYARKRSKILFINLFNSDIISILIF